MKSIKTTLLLSYLSILSIVLISGCKKDTASKSPIVGKWPLVYQRTVVYNPNGSVNTDYPTPYTGREYLEFFSDGHCFAYWEDSDQESFPYTYDEAGKKLIFGTGSSVVTYQITKFTATELEITHTDATAKYEGRMKR